MKRISIHLFVVALLCAAVLSLTNFSVVTASRRAMVPPDAAAIYSAKCAKCHGADGRGVAKYKKSGQQDFTDAKWQKSRTNAQLTESIADGKGDFMPAWKGKFSAGEIEALVAYVRAFGKKK